MVLNYRPDIELKSMMCDILTHMEVVVGEEREE